MEQKSFRKKPHFHYDNETLNKLISDSTSCVTVKKCPHHITLHPFHLRNINESIKDILNNGIAKYNQNFQGILLGYQNIKIFGTEAAMSDDTCYMHFDIEAEFYIFKPEISSALNGIVNKKSDDHVGCLVHQIFNVVIPKPHGNEDWMGFTAEIGNEVQLKITKLNLSAGLPYIQAELVSILSENIGLSTKNGQNSSKNKSKITKFDSDEEKMKKKKKKHKPVDNNEEVKLKVKNKKHNQREDETEKESSEEVDGLTKKVKRKKVKCESSENLISNLKNEYLDVVSEMCKDLDSQISDKEKKIKIKKEKVDDDILTLPSLNMEEILEAANFNASSNSMSHQLNHSKEDAGNVLLFSDSELDEIIGTKKSKRNAKNASPESQKSPNQETGNNIDTSTNGYVSNGHKRTKKSKRDCSDELFSDVIQSENVKVKKISKKLK